MKKMRISPTLAPLLAVALVVVCAFSLVTIARAATTIGTDIQTDGMLSVTGTTTLNGVIQDVNPDWQDGTPTSVFLSDGTNSLCEGVIGGFGTSNSVVIGGGATLSPCTPDDAVVIGRGAQSIGHGNNYYQVVIGYGAQSLGNDPKNVVIGAQSQSESADNVVLGYSTSAALNRSVVIGSQATSSAANSIAIGYFATVAAGGTGSLALGGETDGASSIDIWGNDVTGNNSASWGDSVDVISANNTYVYGTSSTFNGFGTPSPQNRLDISGASAIGSYAGVNTAPSNSLIISGQLGVGSSTPIANLQVANGNATTTVEFGSKGESKGSCLKLYRTDGTAIYAYVAAGATTFTLSTTACASVSNF